MAKRTRFPGIKRRGQWLHFQSTYADGTRLTGNSGCRVGEEAKAFAALQVLRRADKAKVEVLEQLDAGADLPAGVVTWRTFSEWWQRVRAADAATKKASKQDKWKLDYINLVLGDVVVDESRNRHGIDFVKWLKRQEGRRGKLSSRTVRSVWSCLHCMADAAVRKELLPVNPFTLPEQGEDALPPLEDKEGFDRDGAVFERYEVERLISDEQLPEWRRVLWGLLFFTSVRPGEAFATSWAQYDTRADVLGKLTINRAFNTAEKAVGNTKTKRRRLTPVHPTLALILTRWRASGWKAHMGRAPTPEDLIIPNAQGTHLRVDDTLDWFREDLATLGLPRLERRQYDLRRTFKSLAEGDGAAPHLLRWVMWGSRGDVADGYTSMPWAPVCTEILKLKVELRPGKVLELRSAVGGSETAIETIDPQQRNSLAISRADTETRTPDLLITNQSGPPGGTWWEAGTRSGYGSFDAPGCGRTPPDEAQTVSLSNPGPEDAIAAGLGAAAAEWRSGRDVKRLRKRLAALLLTLEDERNEP